MENTVKEKSKGFIEILELFYKNGNFLEAFSSHLDDIKDEKLSSVKKALCLGAGPGKRESEILKKLTPNLEKAVFVDSQKECCEEMLKNVPTYLGDKVACKVEECDMTEWDNGGEKFDAILLISSLYGFLDENERRAFLKKCFNQWLVPEGKLFILLLDDSIPDEIPLMNMVYNNLGLESVLSLHEIRKDLKTLEKKFKEYSFKYDKDLNNIGDGMIDFIHYYCPVPKTKSEIKEELVKLKENGHTAKGVSTMCLVDNN